MKCKGVLLLCGLVLLCCLGIYAQEKEERLLVGAERMELYLPKLEGKKVGIVANQTSVVRNSEGGLVHLLDTLLSLGVDVSSVFSPEHGFRGNAEAGAMVESGVDKKTGVRVVSLYGKNKKPTKAQIEQCDVLLFDLQDVGCRFYTYISTLHYVMEACAEAQRPLLVLDRPNPNDYVDGPVLEKEFQSFVGMHPVPVVYGLTIGEYSLMINSQGWLSGKVKCEVEVVPLKGWWHDMETAYELPVAPSPNLPNAASIALYPSLCWFEGTVVSVGRGTASPFEIIGYPNYCDTTFSFTPRAIKGVSKNPPYKDKLCHGLKLSPKPQKRIELGYIINMYGCYGQKDKFFNSFFYKLSGNRTLRQQIETSVSEEQIRLSWSEDLEKYKKIRKQYLLYERK